MQAFALKMGYGLAPDPYYHHVKADVDGTLVLFPAAEGGRFSPSPEFISAVMTLRLGAMVALIDDSLDQAEQKVLENAINNNPASPMMKTLSTCVFNVATSYPSQYDRNEK